MKHDASTEIAIADVEADIREWRQGDCVLGQHWFVWRYHLHLPLTPQSKEAASSEIDLAETEEVGLVVVSQTCDIVRAPAARPYVEVSPLVRLSSQDFAHAARGQMARYAALPALAEHRLVADLERTMTVEKAVLLDWDRTPGWSSDAQARTFAEALARRRNRFAFPDVFQSMVQKLRKRLVEKHSKQTDEGNALRALREIRVRAAPSWDAKEVELFFWFVREEPEEAAGGKPWSEWLDGWLKHIALKEPFTTIDGTVAGLADMTAQDYLESDRLELDYLSNTSPDD